MLKLNILQHAKHFKHSYVLVIVDLSLGRLRYKEERCILLVTCLMYKAAIKCYFTYMMYPAKSQIFLVCSKILHLKILEFGE